MGLFGNKSREQRNEKGLSKAEDLAAGKGMAGRMMKRYMGAEEAARLGDGVAAARGAQAAQAAQAAGAAGVTAQVTALADTGQLMNFDPVVDLSVTLPDGQAVQLQTVVSKVQVPRVGDSVTLIPDPSSPGAYLYGGPTG